MSALILFSMYVAMGTQRLVANVEITSEIALLHKKCAPSKTIEHEDDDILNTYSYQNYHVKHFTSFHL